MSKLTKKEFDRIREAGKRLQGIFVRDRYEYEPGTEEYIIRAVQEATQEGLRSSDFWSGVGVGMMVAAGLMAVLAAYRWLRMKARCNYE